jgi:hypothetical protein
MPRPLSFPAAEILALQALAWLAEDGERLERLLAASGMDGASLRGAGQDPHLLAAILAFLLADEPLLLEFCAQNRTEPALVHGAQHKLEGGCD